MARQAQRCVMRDGAAIAAARNGRRYSGGWMFRCPCHNDHKPSASIRDDGLVTCFAGCSRADVSTALDALGFTDDDRITTVAWTDDSEKRIRKAQEDWAWSEKLTRPEDVEFVEWYLRSRGITLPIPAVLRRAGVG